MDGWMVVWVGGWIEDGWMGERLSYSASHGKQSQVCIL